MAATSTDHGFILASRSPRRKHLLQQAGLTFEVQVGDFDEATVPFQSPEDFVRLQAVGKAESVAALRQDRWVLGADTTVAVDDRLLGKPGSTDEARGMLGQLSGRWHRVLTGFALVCKSRGRRISQVVATRVEFKRLSVAEVDWYIATREPFDKAGGYGIQGIGALLVRRIDGSYTNVVGLPVCEVVERMVSEGVVRFP